MIFYYQKKFFTFHKILKTFIIFFISTNLILYSVNFYSFEENYLLSNEVLLNFFLLSNNYFYQQRLFLFHQEMKPLKQVFPLNPNAFPLLSSTGVGHKKLFLAK